MTNFDYVFDFTKVFVHTFSTQLYITCSQFSTLALLKMYYILFAYFPIPVYKNSFSVNYFFFKSKYGYSLTISSISSQCESDNLSLNPCNKGKLIKYFYTFDFNNLNTSFCGLLCIDSIDLTICRFYVTNSFRAYKSIYETI